MKRPGLLLLEETARRIGRALKPLIPEGAGFCVLVFNMGEKGHITYVSNAERKDMLTAMKEFIVHSETGAIAPPGQPNHPANKPGSA